MSTAVSTDMPDIRDLQSRTVVDSVAEESDDVALGVQGSHDPLLLRRRQLGEDRRAVGDVGELGVAHLRDLAAEQDLARLPASPHGKSCA